MTITMRLLPRIGSVAKFGDRNVADGLCLMRNHMQAVSKSACDRASTASVCDCIIVTNGPSIDVSIVAYRMSKLYGLGVITVATPLIVVTGILS